MHHFIISFNIFVIYTSLFVLVVPWAVSRLFGDRIQIRLNALTPAITATPFGKVDATIDAKSISYVLTISCGSRTCKPNSVREIAPAGRPFLWAAHCCGALATYPKVGRTEPARVRDLIPKNQSRELPSYLVLLRVGFALPATLLSWRCALTAPFHPYPSR